MTHRKGSGLITYAAMQSRVHELEEEVKRLMDELAKQRLETQELERDLASAANHLAVAQTDSLTGLPTRAVFEQRLEIAVEKARSEGLWLSVVFLDIGALKAANDQYGHHGGGDRLLRSMTKILLNAMRRSDTVVRWGGDEFAIILPGADPVILRAVVARIQRAVDGCFVLVGLSSKGHLMQLKAVIGGVVAFGENVAMSMAQEADDLATSCKGKRRDSRASTVIKISLKE